MRTRPRPITAREDRFQENIHHFVRAARGPTVHIVIYVMVPYHPVPRTPPGYTSDIVL